MLKNLAITAFRNLYKNRFSTALNVAGLAIGATCSIVVFAMLHFETSFDQQHTHASQLYCVGTKTLNKDQGDHYYGLTTCYPLAEALRAGDSSLKTTVLHGPSDAFIETETLAGRQKFLEEQVLFAEPGFFSFLDYGMGDALFLVGSPNTALQEVNSMVITRKLAEKYFGDVESAFNQVIKLNNKEMLKITGVVENVPRNTSFPFQAVISFATLRNMHGNYLDQWGATWNGSTLVKVANPAELERALNEAQLLYDRNLNEKDPVAQVTATLEPLASLHTEDRYEDSATYILPGQVFWGMLVLGLFGLLTACVNFVNVATAQSLKRAREVGMRKVMGGTRWQLVAQFLAETGMVVLVAIVLALALAEYLLVEINSVLSIIFYDLHLTPVTAGFALLLAVVVTLLAGAWPAFVISSFRPVVALKSKLLLQRTGGQRGAFSLRKILIVSQFVFVQLALIVTLVIALQMHFMRNKDLGFEKEAIMTVDTREVKVTGKMENFRARLQAIPEVKNVCFGFDTPISNGGWGGRYYLKGASEDKAVANSLKHADEHYLETFGIQLLAGRNFGSGAEFAELDGEMHYNVLVNELACQKMGLASPEGALGREIYFNGNWQGTITGVVNNFHIHSVKEEMLPLIIMKDPAHYNMAAVKLAAKGINSAQQQVQKAFTSIFPGEFYNRRFMDDIMDDIYIAEDFMYRMAGLFAIINIIIGCMGLYGLVAFMASSKTREIGIRKTLGASSASILWMFSSEFLKILAAAFTIAAPLGWFSMRFWLGDFTYRINFTPLHLLWAFVISFVLVAVTAGYRSLVASVANPVDSLKQE